MKTSEILVLSNLVEIVLVSINMTSYQEVDCLNPRIGSRNIKPHFQAGIHKTNSPNMQFMSKTCKR